MFKAGKTYKTCDGRDFRVYATDGADPYPIHGAIKCNNEWTAATRTESGRKYEGKDSDSDLIPDPPPLPTIDITKPCRTRDGRAVANLRKSGDYIVGDIVNRATGTTIVDALWRPNGKSAGSNACNLVQCTARPWARADVPWPRPEFRRIANETGNWMTVHWIRNDGVGFSGVGFLSWSTLQSDWQYSVDGGKTWLACEVAE